jgi:hypothetical protein
MVGRILEASKYFNHPDYLDISEGLVFSDTAYPELYNVIKDEDWANATLAIEINNPTPVASDNFGSSVAIYGDTAVIGVEDDGVNVGGSIRVYRYNGSSWLVEQIIPNPSVSVGDLFGRSVSIYMDTIAVGSIGYDGTSNEQGRAYIYKRTGTTWALEGTLENPLPALGAYMGNSVSIYNDTCAVGIYADTEGADDTGAVLIFTRSGTTWSLEQKILNPTAVAYDFFGISVRLYEDTCIIGANQEDTGASAAGSAYVYTRSGTVWTLDQTINNPAPTITAHFGKSVALHNDTCAIAAINTGNVYIYNRINNIWVLGQTIIAAGQAGGNGGSTIHLHNGTLAIGAPTNTAGPLGNGTVFVYKRIGTTWSLQKSIYNPSSIDNDDFGDTVGINDDTVIIGAMWEDTGISGAGSAYIYSIPLTNDNIIQPRETGNPDTKYFVKAK